MGFTVLVTFAADSFCLLATILLANRTKRYRIYKAKSMPEIIMGMSCVRKVYSDKSIGMMNLASLKVIVYHEATATNRTQITPKMIVRFVLFFIMPSSKEMYLSLDEINISLSERAVNRKDTNTSLSVLQKNKTPDARAL